MHDAQHRTSNAGRNLPTALDGRPSAVTGNSDSDSLLQTRSLRQRLQLCPYSSTAQKEHLYFRPLYSSTVLLDIITVTTIRPYTYSAEYSLKRKHVPSEIKYILLYTKSWRRSRRRKKTQLMSWVAFASVSCECVQVFQFTCVLHIVGDWQSWCIVRDRMHSLTTATCWDVNDLWGQLHGISISREQEDFLC